jgi:hypothetical protein
MNSFKTEVVADSTGKWAGNALRFATRAEADDYVSDLMRRWTSVRGWRSVKSDDPVTHRFAAGRVVEVKDAQG